MKYVSINIYYNLPIYEVKINFNSDSKQIINIKVANIKTEYVKLNYAFNMDGKINLHI